MPAILAMVFAGLRIFLLANLIGFVVRVIAGLGFYFLVAEPVTDAVMDVLTNKFSAIPQGLADWIGFLKFDVYVGMVMSAYAIVQVTNFVVRKR